MDKLIALIAALLAPKPNQVLSTDPSVPDLGLIKQFEGLVLKAYLCPARVWTIGYGHTRGVKRGDVITQAGADAFLMQDIGWVRSTLASSVKVPLTQNQTSALCSFIYNVGAGAFRSSTLLRLLNKGQYGAAQGQFKRWNKAGGKTLRGLTRRRAAEAALFGKAK
jgi:lysozyme